LRLMNAQNSGWALDFPRMSSQTSELFEHSKVFGVFQQPVKSHSGVVGT